MVGQETTNTHSPFSYTAREHILSSFRNARAIGVGETRCGTVQLNEWETSVAGKVSG